MNGVVRDCNNGFGIGSVILQLKFVLYRSETGFHAAIVVPIVSSYSRFASVLGLFNQLTVS
jgi:hypothetical protein